MDVRSSSNSPRESKGRPGLRVDMEARTLTDPQSSFCMPRALFASEIAYQGKYTCDKYERKNVNQLMINIMSLKGVNKQIYLVMFFAVLRRRIRYNQDPQLYLSFYTQ